MVQLVDDNAGRPTLEAGTRVEVRTGFDRSWSAGFEVESATEHGYRVRRRTDGQVLPATFTNDDVRREHNNSMWWY